MNGHLAVHNHIDITQTLVRLYIFPRTKLGPRPEYDRRAILYGPRTPDPSGIGTL